MGLTSSLSVTLCGVVSKSELERCLRRIRQTEWSTNVRLHGLLLLIDLLCRNHKANGLSISARVAHDYISNIKRPKAPTTIREPLAVLCEAGILNCVRPAVNGWHVKKAATYALDDKYSNKSVTLKVVLPAKLATKRRLALQRREQGLNRRYPYREKLLVDLATLSFGFEVCLRTLKLLREPSSAPATQRVLDAVVGGNHWVKVSVTQQITTSITGCPRELKEHLLLAGESIAFCDISHAHHCFLPKLLVERIEHIRRKHEARADVSHHEAELTRLVAFLSEGDYYQKWCRDPEGEDERERKKELLNVLLNSPNAVCQRNGFYQKMRRRFPITFSICEDIKRRDNGDLSKPLRFFTATTINNALLEAQALRIPAIPDVDAIICPGRCREDVCRLIGQQLYNITGGVRCKVDEIRYAPIDSHYAANTESTHESAFPASGDERHSGASTSCSVRLTDCVPYLPICEAPIAASKDSQWPLCE